MYCVHYAVVNQSWANWWTSYRYLCASMCEWMCLEFIQNDDALKSRQLVVYSRCRNGWPRWGPEHFIHLWISFFTWPISFARVLFVFCLCQLHLYLTPFAGHEEHSARVASISLGMVLVIVIPCLLLLVCGANYWIRERIAKEEEEAAAALLPKSKWKRP